MTLLQDKTCVITGGAGSLGIATARLFLSQGAQILLVDLDSELLREAGELLAPHRVLTHAADVSDPDQTRGYMDAAERAWGRIDILFCNAGNSGHIGMLEDYPDDGLEAVFRVHVKGTFLACKYGAPLIPQGGSVIITSSVAGLSGTAGVYAYCTAKHAQIGLMRSLAKEMAGRGIRVNSIHPGPVDNGFQQRIEQQFGDMIGGADAGALMDSLIPLGRHANPDEIARSVLYLASDQSSFTTGSMLVVDGGMTA